MVTPPCPGRFCGALSLLRTCLFALFFALVVALLPGCAAVPSPGQPATNPPGAPPPPATPAVSATPQPAEKAATAADAKTPAATGNGSGGSAAHVAKGGETLKIVARQYLSQSSLMTVQELEDAIAAANPGTKHGTILHAGEKITVPTILQSPIVEKSVPIAADTEVRAIYLTGAMAGSAAGIQLIRKWAQTGGNAVVFDIKDSDGSLSIPFAHPLAPPGSHLPISNLPKLLHFLHGLNLHGIARIALFRDQYQASHHSDLAVRSAASKGPWRENGKLVWLDPSRKTVQDYDLALAQWVAQAGADEIQFDYVRFPAEGNQKDARFDFMTEHPQWTRAQVITDFLSRAYSTLHPLGVLLSLDVFGVMAWQRDVDLRHTGQDIASMSKYCDVLSPMIYPSHFFHMDGYASPGDAPEHFIGTSMERFHRITSTGSHVVLRPWLQAFAWRTKTYSPEYIKIQVKTSKAKGGNGFLLWNARNDYSKPFTAMEQMRARPSQYLKSAEAEPARSPGKAAPLAAKAK